MEGGLVMDPGPHVSDLRWDRLLAGELAGLDKTAAAEHAAACPACAARLAVLTAEHEAFSHRARIVPPPATVRRSEPRRSQRWSAIAASVGAIAAAAIIVFVIHARPDARPGERTKGSAPGLLLAAGPKGRLAPVASGDRIHPGDYVQAGYTAARDGFGAVLSRDGTGKAMAYVPSSGDALVALPAGTLRSFPESTVLDAVVGEESVIVLWCAAARPLASLIAELEATGTVAARAGCTMHRVVLDKRAEPR
jgi:hypothetical protein